MGKSFKNGIVILVIIFSILSSNKAEAFSFSFVNNITSGFSNIANSVSNILNIIDTIIKPKIQTDFCTQYNNALLNQEWKNGEFRTTLGESVCSSSTLNFSSSTTKIVKTINDVSPTKKVVLPSTSHATTTDNINTGKVETVKNSPIIGNFNVSSLVLDPMQIIYWTNISRNNNGSLKFLVDDQTLDKIAEKRVDDMFAKTYFEHIFPSGDDVSKEADSLGYAYIVIGENIALGNFESSKSLVDAWMNSPTHRENILNKNFTNIGVSTKTGTYNGQKVSISAQIFSKPLSACISPSGTIKSQLDLYNQTAVNLKTKIDALSIVIRNDQGSNQAELSQYNSFVDSYNNLVTEIKFLAEKYNQQVSVYNNCIKN